MTRVAVNIVTWNSSDYIITCLNYLHRQTYPDFTITIIDNASTDDTVERIQSWQKRPVHLIQNKANRGFAPAHNQGIDATQAPFVLVLNPDIILNADFLTHMVAALQADSSLGSVSAKLLQLTKEQFLTEEIPPTPLIIDGAGLTMNRSRRQHLNGHTLPAAQHFIQPQAIFGPDGAAPLYRRTMLEDVAIKGEYFDELFVTHKEDVDLAWRAQLFGWGSQLVPQATAYHIRSFRPHIGGKVARSRKNHSASVRIDAVKNRWLMLLKNEQLATFLRHLPFILTYDVAIIGYMLLFEQRSLAAIPRTLRLLGPILERRRLIQTQRRATAAHMIGLFR